MAGSLEAVLEVTLFSPGLNSMKKWWQRERVRRKEVTIWNSRIIFGLCLLSFFRANPRGSMLERVHTCPPVNNSSGGYCPCQMPSSIVSCLQAIHERPPSDNQQPHDITVVLLAQNRRICGKSRRIMATLLELFRSGPVCQGLIALSSSLMG